MMGLPQISKSFFILIFIANLISCEKERTDYITRKTPLKNQEIIQNGISSPKHNAKPNTKPQKAIITQKSDSENAEFYHNLFDKNSKDKSITIKDEVADNNLNNIKQQFIKKAKQQKSTAKNIVNEELYFNPYLNKKTKKSSTSYNNPNKLSKGFYVQIGAYSKKSNALRLTQKLTKYQKVNIIDSKHNNKNLSKVIIGPFESLNELITVKKLLEDDGFSKTIIMHEK